MALKQSSKFSTKIYQKKFFLWKLRVHLVTLEIIFTVTLKSFKRNNHHPYLLSNKYFFYGTKDSFHWKVNMKREMGVMKRIVSYINEESLIHSATWHSTYMALLVSFIKANLVSCQFFVKACNPRIFFSFNNPEHLQLCLLVWSTSVLSLYSVQHECLFKTTILFPTQRQLENCFSFPTIFHHFLPHSATIKNYKIEIFLFRWIFFIF